MTEAIFSSSDLGALALARVWMREDVSRRAEVYCGDFPSVKGAIVESDFYAAACSFSASQTRFGRIGILYDRSNTAARNFCAATDFSSLFSTYKPANPRALSTPCVRTYELLALQEIANAGIADSVEFRRLLRKVIRRVKQEHCDTVVFLDAIFCEESTMRVIQHICGTQIRVITLAEALSLQDIASPKLQTQYRIHTTDDPKWVLTRAQQILRTKLPNETISPL